MKVMGVVNVTPDSFFPGSRVPTTEMAVKTGRTMTAHGADLLDVGGESTRPGAEPVSEADELGRVVPVVRALADLSRVSVDTQKAAVATAAADAGAVIVNDISGELAELAGGRHLGYVAMHRQGDSRTMQVAPRYADVVSEVEAFLAGVAERARGAGVTELYLDPGIGFGKSVAHNLSLLAHLDRIADLARFYGAEVLIGTSRKRFLSHLGSSELEVDERLEGTIATGAWALLHGASVLRVHDVAAARRLVDLVTRPLTEVAA